MAWDGLGWLFQYDASFWGFFSLAKCAWARVGQMERCVIVRVCVWERECVYMYVCMYVCMGVCVQRRELRNY